MLRGGAAAGQLQSREPHPPKRRLVAVGEHLAQQQPFRRLRGDIADKLGERALQRLSDLQENQDRGVADAIFKIGQVPLRNAGGAGERFAGQPPTHAQSFRALAERGQKRLLGLLGCLARREVVRSDGEIGGARFLDARCVEASEPAGEEGSVFDKVRALPRTTISIILHHAEVGKPKALWAPPA